MHEQLARIQRNDIGFRYQRFNRNSDSTSAINACRTHGICLTLRFPKCGVTLRFTLKPEAEHHLINSCEQ